MKLHLPFDFSRLKEIDRDTAKIGVFGAVGLVVLMVISGIIVFFLSLRSPEQTMVPDLRGMDLPQALLVMQEKELYPRLQMRFSEKGDERGKVIEQKPSPGTIVKAGRRISITVSRGTVVDKVENYIGQNVSQLKTHLQSLFASQSKPLIMLKEPFVYVYDKAAAGTILQQKPLPDTELGAPVDLELVVSRGPEKLQVKVPDLTGLSIPDALLQLEKSGAAFSFSSRRPEGREKPGTVTSQLPAPGTMVPAATRVNAVVALPPSTKDMAYGILKQALPEYPYPLKLSLDAILPSGERLSVLRVDHPGGDFSVPYQVAPGTVFVLSVLDREVLRHEVKKE